MRLSFTFLGVGLLSALPSSLSEDVEGVDSSASSSSSVLSSEVLVSSFLLAKALRRPILGRGGIISKPSHQKVSLQMNFLSLFRS